ncbi:ATP-binding protein [Tepidicaulis sp. LMO-SS28]|uniref:ATP-binding protein n=1 Tax=Tepidicaulis sp. LMO-SS28 TaxID=3447455 RepID=UPI003EE36876
MLGTLLLLLPAGQSFAAPPAEASAPLKAGIYNNPPKLFINERGEAAGFFPAVLEVLASSQGRQISYVPCEWAACLDMLANGQIDILPDVALTESRATLVKFGDVPVLRSWSYIYSRPGQLIQRLDDIKGKRIAVLNESVQHQWLRTLRAQEGWNFELLPTARQREIFTAVTEGQADLGIANNFSGERVEQEFPLVRSQVTFQPAGLFLAFSPSTDEALIQSFDAKISELVSNPESAYFDAYYDWLRTTAQPIIPFWVYVAAGIAALVLSGSFLLTAIFRNRVAKATEEINESKNKLVQAQIIARVGDFTWDLRTNAIDWSRGMRHLLGYDAGTSVNVEKVFQDVHHPDDTEWVRQWIDAAIAEGSAGIGPKIYRLLRKDAKVIFVETNMIIEYEDGEARRIFGTCHDVTRQIEAQNALRDAMQKATEASRAKSDFLATMSHELRTPLNAIIGFSEMLQITSASSLNDAQKERINDIKSAGEQLLHLVNDILDMSSIEAGQFHINMAYADPSEIIRQSLAQVRDLASKAGVALETNLENLPPVHIYTDARRVQQIAVNLLSNAIKYNHKGGWVRVSGALKDKDRFFRLSVEDSGAGIPADKREAVFELFSRLHPDAMTAGGGAGIGLSVTKLLAERLGGSIDFESREGAGSLFWVDLPLDENAAAAAK